MALKADESNFMPLQHPGIHGAVRLVATAAALHLDGRMLVRERTAHFAMAAYTARLIRVRGIDHARKHAAMGIVAVDA